jgi:anti-anti-sigma factor
METAKFKIIENKAIVQLYKNVHFHNMVEVEKLFCILFEKRPTLIAINCSMLYSIDSTVIAFFVQIAKEAESLNIKMAFYNLNEELKYIFTLINFGSIISIVTKEQLEDEFGKLSE